MIKKCIAGGSENCESKYQDEKYGKGNRVHNERRDKTKAPRCTVCGRENS